MRTFKIILSIFLVSRVCFLAGQGNQFENGLPDDPAFFPIAVWLQDPADAAAYKAGGINLYIGLWQGPTEVQLSALRTAGMPVMCSQNSTGLNHLDDSIIVGWTQQDEPDNAQANGSGGYDPCVDPEIVEGIYDDLKANDQTRPVYLNLGQGVSNINYVGRGECTGDTWMYPYYIEGCDIVSYDIYPVTSKYEHIRDNLWYVADGIDNLREWSEDSKPAWCWIETTHINSENKPTPYQVKAEVWMALIHGARGFGYFCHEWIPEFNANALLDDPVMFPAVTTLNSQIHQLAPVLNAPDLEGVVSVHSENTSVPVDVLVKHYKDTLYVFAVAMRDGSTSCAFSVTGAPEQMVTVIGEDREIMIADESFEDSFEGYGVHLYKLGYDRTGLAKHISGSLLAYPNPGSGFFKIAGENSMQKCAVINMTGKVFQLQGNNDRSIDLRGYKPGIYILCMWINDKPLYQKIVIEN